MGRDPDADRGHQPDASAAARAQEAKEYQDKVARQQAEAREQAAREAEAKEVWDSWHRMFQSAQNRIQSDKQNLQWLSDELTFLRGPDAPGSDANIKKLEDDYSQETDPGAKEDKRLKLVDSINNIRVNKESKQSVQNKIAALKKQVEEDEGAVDHLKNIQPTVPAPEVVDQPKGHDGRDDGIPDLIRDIKQMKDKLRLIDDPTEVVPRNGQVA